MGARIKKKGEKKKREENTRRKIGEEKGIEIERRKREKKERNHY